MIPYFPTTALCIFPDKTKVVVWVKGYDELLDQCLINWKLPEKCAQEMWVPAEWLDQSSNN